MYVLKIPVRIVKSMLKDVSVATKTKSKKVKKKVSKSRGPRNSYSWEKWIVPGTHRLVIGKDIDCKLVTFRSNFWRRAAAVGLQVRSFSQHEVVDGKNVEVATFVVTKKSNGKKTRTKRSSENAG